MGQLLDVEESLGEKGQAGETTGEGAYGLGKYLPVAGVGPEIG